MEIKTRYRYEIVPVSETDALAWRARDVEHIENQIADLQAELAELRAAALPTERNKQIALEPGDPGYDDAPLALHLINYQGDWKWELSNAGN